MSSVIGKTVRAYRFAPTSDDYAIVVPPGMIGFAIKRNAEALVASVGTAAVVVDSDGSSIISTAFSLAADDGTQARELLPLRAGEVISISHSDGGTGIGAFELHAMFVNGFPLAAASNFTVSDPGA